MQKSKRVMDQKLVADLSFQTARLKANIRSDEEATQGVIKQLVM